jgi:threonine dehydrogenase-like Zn-dependent dehydrogenase
MKAIVNLGPGLLALKCRDRPDPAPGEVRIRTGACAICATDLDMISGWDRTGFPAVPGHEWAGTVDSVGEDVDPDLVGMKCVAENVLSDGGEVGFEHPGGYGSYLVTEAANLYALPNDFDLTTGALIEPLAVCVRGVRRLGPQDLTQALILGDGPIGLLMLMLLKRRGVERVVMVGGRSGRLELARELGAAATFDYRDLGEPLSAAVEHATGDDFPTVVEASGSPKAARAALELAGHDARVLIMGDYAEARHALRWNDILHREITLIGSNASAGAWPDAVRLATSGAVDLSRLVSHTFKAEDFATAMTLVHAEGEDTTKVVLTW